MEHERYLGRLRSMLPKAAFTALWTGGRTMVMEQAIEFALGSFS